MAKPFTEDKLNQHCSQLGMTNHWGHMVFSSCYKKTWEIVGQYFMVAILEFFSSGSLLNQINHTEIVLIPKASHAPRVEDYWPSAYCNVTYKVITEMHG